MGIPDSKTFAELAVKVGLITADQKATALIEVVTAYGENPPPLRHLISWLRGKKWLTTYQATKLIKGDTTGYFQGNYRLLRKIQSGSFGHVYRAIDTTNGRQVAVKVLRRRWSQDKQWINQFVREGTVGMSLKHPNIVETLAVDRDPHSKQYYLAMEFVDGGNLRELLKKTGKLSILESLRLLEGAASGLAHAYSRGIVHRDIKPNNILLTVKGVSKLVDFGLAQMFASLDREGTSVSRTIEYAGLEKATGVRTGDVRSDLFFLGCVFYECLTGRPPLASAKDRLARMQAGRFQEIQPLTTADLQNAGSKGEDTPHAVQASASLFELCHKLIAFDPQERYQTPMEVLRAIETVRRDLGAASGTKTLFLIESDERLREGLREMLRRMGYRVLLAADPARAWERFSENPFDALIVDVGTTGPDGAKVFQRIMTDARDRQIKCAGIALFNENQADEAQLVPTDAATAVLLRPVSAKELRRKLKKLTRPER